MITWCGYVRRFSMDWPLPFWEPQSSFTSPGENQFEVQREYEVRDRKIPESLGGSTGCYVKILECISLRTAPERMTQVDSLGKSNRNRRNMPRESRSNRNQNQGEETEEEGTDECSWVKDGLESRGRVHGDPRRGGRSLGRSLVLWSWQSRNTA